MEYPDDPDEPRRVEAYLDVEEVPLKSRRKLLTLALSLGFEPDEDEDETPPDEFVPTLLIDPATEAVSGRKEDDRRVWTTAEFADAVLTIERAALAAATTKTARTRR